MLSTRRGRSQEHQEIEPKNSWERGIGFSEREKTQIPPVYITDETLLFFFVVNKQFHFTTSRRESTRKQFSYNSFETEVCVRKGLSARNSATAVRGCYSLCHPKTTGCEKKGVVVRRLQVQTLWFRWDTHPTITGTGQQQRLNAPEVMRNSKQRSTCPKRPPACRGC